MRSHILALSLGVAAVATSSAAFAEPASGRPTAPSTLPEPTSESSWDIPGWFIVDARDDLSASEVRDLGSELGVPLHAAALSDTTKIHLGKAAPSSIEAIVRSLARDPRVERVEPLAWVRTQLSPNDPLLEEQWHMERIGAPGAWDYATGRGVTVAVVDTGVACETHGPFTKGTDLNQTTCVKGWSFISNNEHANDDQGHGTHVAGTIAQSTNNGLGAAGVAFHARLMPVKVLNSRGMGTTLDVANGIRWAADNGAHVINLSLGGPRNSRVLEDAVAHARKKGVVVVAAAGNSGGAVGFPGGSTGVIGVSATDSNDKLANFSSRGKGVDIAAPGVNVVQQTICNGGRDGCERFPGLSGTSMASPHVAGVAALLIGMGVTDADAVERALTSSARVVDDSPGADRLYGAGILDAGAAVRSLWWKQLLTRLGALALIVLLVTASARKKSKAANPLSPGFILGALAAGPGLFFLAPLVASRAYFPLDVLSRPIGDLDLLLGASLHAYLPLANALWPALLTAMFFHVRALRPLVGGLAAGTAAYLLSTLVLGHVAAPFGSVLLVVWCAVNAFVCAAIARIHLAETR